MFESLKRQAPTKYRGALIFLTLFLGFAGTASAQIAGLPWQATFDAGNFDEWDGWRNTTNATFQTSGCVSSGRCVRVPLIANTTNDTYGDHYFGDHIWAEGTRTKVEEVWLTFHTKFEPNYVWPSSSQKLAILNLTDGQTSDRRYQVYVYVRSNGEYAVDRSNIATWQFFGIFQNVGTVVSPRASQWDKLKLHVKLNTPGQANGIVQLWVNGELKVNYSNQNIREGTSMGVNKLILSSYSTRENGGNGALWWDNVSLSQTDPDGATAVRPNPPTDVRVQ
jgi:hypothetical protein